MCNGVLRKSYLIISYLQLCHPPPPILLPIRESVYNTSMELCNGVTPKKKNFLKKSDFLKVRFFNFFLFIEGRGGVTPLHIVIFLIIK